MSNGWIDARTEPPGHGYYLAVWMDEGNHRISELWFNPDSTGSGWWATRGYMSRFTGEAMGHESKRSLTVIAWMTMPEYPGPGRIIAYKWTASGDRSEKAGGSSLILDPHDVTIVREGPPAHDQIP
jgi:hypothetical protein